MPAERTLRLPKPPPLPTKVPFEDGLNRTFNRLADSMERGPMGRLNQRLKMLPSIAGATWPTPLGTVEIPTMEPPDLRLPNLDERKKEALKAALGQDLATIVGFIPVVGDIVADVVEDLYFQKVHGLLRADEFESFKRYDANSPTTLAMIRTFVKHR